VGDEIFFATVRGLIEEFAGKALTLDGLRDAFIEAAPEADLAPFFAQWLDRAGAPVLDLKWKALAGGNAELSLLQVQKGEPYRLQLEVAIETRDGRTNVHPVAVSGRETRVQLAVDGEIERIRLDPNHRLLIWQPEYGARP
jgi:aminopeptidase N